MARRPELDALRGLMLVLITFTHVPTVFADRFSQPFGFVSAAEGFVFLSAFLTGAIYTGIARNSGCAAMRAALWRRARKIYFAHAGMLLFLFTIIAAIGISAQRPAVKNLISFYLGHPGTGLWTGFALIYNPPLLDILPMYVLFMLVSPLVLTLAFKRGWRVILAASLAIWACAQFGLANLLYAGLVGATRLKVPLQETGAFQLVAWQLLWVLGMWLGWSAASGRERVWEFPRWLVWTAIALATWALLWRHLVGQQPFGAASLYNILADKWQLAPLRLLNFLALLVLAVRFGPQLAPLLARLHFLEVLGKASLPVFCAQLVIALLALCAIGDRFESVPVWDQAVLLGASFAVLYAVARSVEGKKRAAVRRAAPMRPASARAG